jgi:hypothetical protein
MPELIYHSSPEVTFASNTFINVPIILQFDETPLVSVVREQNLGYTTEIPIYHSDGTYLAKVRGTRVYSTEQGRAASVQIRQQPGDAFRISAELYTPSGYFVKVSDGPQPQVFNASGGALQVRGIVMIGNVFENLRIGVWIRRDGSVAIGVA